jgi:hydroxypyruvate reductase
MLERVMEPRALLRSLFDAAVAAAAPPQVLPPHLPEPPAGRVVVLGAGKAAAAMARAAERHYASRGVRLGGVAVTPYGHAEPCQQVEVLEGAHPLPDAAGQAAAQRALDAVRGLSEDDLVLCLLSGGGSALWALPLPGVTLEDKRDLGRQLLRSGASIAEINCVRKHLSAIKGGRLGLACRPARVLALLISDVPGDDPGTIASGPTIGDATTAADARAVLARYRISVPPRIARALDSFEAETPLPGDPRLRRCAHVVVATAAGALDAAARAARAAGVEPVVLGADLQGEARALGAEHAARAKALAAHLREASRPGGAAPRRVLLSGGETTVTVRGDGRGGRNAEYALALALALDGEAGVWALAADTDGRDGTEDNAGCVVAPDTQRRARALGLDAAAHLDYNE